MSLRWLGGVALVVGCAAERPAEYSEAVAADPAHYSVEFENDAVRVLRIRYGAGETSVMHSHPSTCSVALTDATWRMTNADGTVTEDPPTTMGEISCDNPATVHSPANVGSAPSELILVELKEGAAPGTWSSTQPGAVAADPGHYTVEWENDVLRVLRVSYGPREQSVLHHHPAYCFIPMNNGTWHMANAAGEVAEIQTTMGQVVCGDADVHRPTNTAADVGGAVLLEFKGRETVAQ